ncbi:hypothetical protein EJ05DRAFT_479092 [Pseudovirgaria hyperparasitica]|uniref:Uncharacterized protein n=1 Tax=Pseudovirgaria hyperparasitica TaxID=470096 RepID=A0A6A6VXX0_9PEZI|nr:uncharacterized protein EJ05DRAFT_479092 [Pseudovirgaria hyperparasitica]KAF2754656.1 hypothetical protein EJ05DRAFT_479092 [Pseudovirgaria hyperparasitica]
MSSQLKSSLAVAIRAIDPSFREGAQTFVERVATQVPIIKAIQLNGNRPHRSHDDPTDTKLVISFALYKSATTSSRNRVGSGHVHADGTGHVNFPSKYKQYRAVTGMEYRAPIGQLIKSGDSSSKESQSGDSSSKESKSDDLTWRTNEQTGYAEWWDGTNWVAGAWSDQNQRWYAFYNGQWYHQK